MPRFLPEYVFSCFGKLKVTQDNRELFVSIVLYSMTSTKVM